ncbi:MAG: hypothetical protein R6U96_16325 [Promethearchaeia archaeon]
MINIILAVFQILIALGIVGFWIGFFIGGKDKMDEIELVHEKTFPLPDLGWIVPLLIIAAIGLILEVGFGYLFSAVAGGGMMFLGLIDFAFHVQNDKYKTKDFDAYFSIFIDGVNIIFSIIFIVYAYFNLQI